MGMQFVTMDSVSLEIRQSYPNVALVCANSFCMVRSYGSKIVQFYYNHNLGFFKVLFVLACMLLIGSRSCLILMITSQLLLRFANL